MNWLEIATFLIQNGPALAALVFAAYNFFTGKAKEVAMQNAVEAVTQMAKTTFDNKEKRKNAVALAYNLSPTWIKKTVKQSDFEMLVEMAWHLQVKRVTENQ